MRSRAEFFFDPEKLIVFRDAVGAARRTGFDLTRTRGDGQIRDEGVLGLARAMRHHGRVAGVGGHAHRFQRFGQGSDLVHLDQNRIGDAFVDAHLQAFRVGDEQIVSHQLDLLAQGIGHRLPSVPIVLGHTVFNRDDGILLHPVGPELDHLLAGALALVRFLEDVLLLAGVVELTGRGIERNADLIAGLVTRLC